MTPSEISGRLDVKVKWREGVIEQVLLSSSRPQRVTELFTGKKVEDVIDLVPMLYSLCGVSQKVAAIKAAESALRIQPTDQVEQIRGMLVTAEAARELALRLYSDWLPDELNIKVKVIKWFVEVNDEYDWALKINPECKNFADLNACANKLDEILMLSGYKFVLNDQSFRSTYKLLSSKMASEVKGVFADESTSLTNAESSVIDFADTAVQAEVVGQLESERAFLFCSEPELRNRPYENSIYSLNYDCNDMNKKGFFCDFGSLEFRFFILSYVLFSMPERIRKGTNDSLIKSSYSGLGIVKAARGVLMHYMVLDGEPVSKATVADYKIVAPTEWNFHPQGTLVKMLEGAKVSKKQLFVLVDSLIRLVDPCVKWQLQLDTTDA